MHVYIYMGVCVSYLYLYIVFGIFTRFAYTVRKYAVVKQLCHNVRYIHRQTDR